MVQLSKFNNTYNALNASANFVGQLENTADLVSISVNVHCDQACRVIIKQYRANDLTTQVQDNAEDVPADTRQVVQTPIKAAFYKIEVVNLAVVDMTFTKITTYLQSTHYVHLDIRHLSQETDNVIMYGVDDAGDKLPIHVDGSGNIVTAGGGGGATSDVNIVSQSANLATETTLLAINSSVASLDSKLAICNTEAVTITGALPTGGNIIGGTASLALAADMTTLTTMNLDVSGNLYVNSKISENLTDFATETTLAGILYDTNSLVYFNDNVACHQVTLATINENIKYCDTENVKCYGKQSNFNFFPTPENNTINIYADETKGTNVVGGWSFTNTGTPSKINWYIYQASNPLGNPTTAGQTVGSALSVYTVINQSSVTTPEYPFVIIYTRADSGTNAGPFKSRLVFQNTTTATTGMKLLYTGSDPVDIHPEITGANRVNLPFNLSASTKALADALNEEILTCSLQTDSSSGAGRYNFVMQQFGVEWVTLPFILPIQNGKVIVDAGIIISTESSPTGAVTKTLGNTGVVVSGVSSTLQSLTISNVLGTLFGYVKLYNKATAPTASDTPVMTLPLNFNSVQQIECHSLAFPLGIGLRATLLFAAGDTTAPDGTCYATAFYTNVIN